MSKSEKKKPKNNISDNIMNNEAETIASSEQAADSRETVSEQVTNQQDAENEANAESVSEAVTEAVTEDVSEAQLTEQSASEPEKPAKKGKKIDITSAVVKIIVVAFFFFALGMLSKTVYAYAFDAEKNKNLQKEVLEDPPKEEEIPSRPDREIPVYPGEMKPSISYPKIITTDKLKELKNANSDFFFWFYIGDTDISYPVMCSGDNDFYLKRDFNKNDNVCGSLFIDFRNVTNTKNLIIYGHNMRNGTMFGSLRNYNEELFFEKHPMIYTYSEGGVTIWQIFSVYPTNTSNPYTRVLFPNDEKFMEYVEKVQKDSLFKADIAVTPEDEIMTLSTCRNGEGDAGRFVVHAVKIQTLPLN